jgi:hypothetical protein
MKKSGILIDKIVNMKHDNLTPIDGEWYIKRPQKDGNKWRLMGFIRRIRACCRVLTDRGLVVYFKEDE